MLALQKKKKNREPGEPSFGKVAEQPVPQRPENRELASMTRGMTLIE